MASYQAQEQIDGWVSNRANPRKSLRDFAEFAECVRRSKLPDTAKAQLHAVNRQQDWFSREPMEGVDPATRVLARSVMRHVMGKHHRPDLSRISPRLDSRIACVARADKAGHFDLWAMLRLPSRGRVAIPLHGNPQFARRGGDLCPLETPFGVSPFGTERFALVQLCTNAVRGITVRRVQDMTKVFAALRAAYVPRVGSLGIDFGLSTLMATSEGTMFGRGLLGDLKRIDKQIVGIARHRQRTGGKPRDSLRYRDLVTRLRGMLKTRISAALNSIVRVHAPASLVVERLDFRYPGLSRRMNSAKWRSHLRGRLTNCGRAVFRQKLADLHDKFSIPASEVPSPYTSQECSSCGYVDAKNRRSRSEFACRWCGHAKHAGANAGCVVAQRRSSGLDAKGLGKGAILDLLMRRHVERWPGTRPKGLPGAARDPRLSTPYFKGWADAARNALATQDLVFCGLKQ